MATVTIGEYIAKHGSQDLYHSASQPTIWVGRDKDGDLVGFPAVQDGWSQRVPYQGSRHRLTSVFIGNAIGTGYPMWEGPLVN